MLSSGKAINCQELSTFPKQLKCLFTYRSKKSISQRSEIKTYSSHDLAFIDPQISFSSMPHLKYLVLCGMAPLEVVDFVELEEEDQEV